MRALSLFSGIGGMDLAATVCGVEIVAFCERDAFCRAVLQTHWPEVPIYPDVKEVSYERLRRDGLLPIDYIYGGPPCQPASLAGRRRGKLDDRWLWPDFLRVVGEVRPRWCVAENPVGILSVDAGRAWGTILGTLVEMGYGCGWGVWGAGDIGAPHRRERVFLLAYLPGLGGDAWGAESARQRGTPDPQRIDRAMADACGDRHREWPNQPECQSTCGDAPDARLDGAQHAVADATGQGYPHRIIGGFPMHPAAGQAGMESQSERYGAVAHTAGRQRQQWAQPEGRWDEIPGGWDVWPDTCGCSDAVADPTRGENRRPCEYGLPSNVAASGRAMADAQSRQRQRRGPARDGESRSANGGDAVADATSTGLEKRAGVERNTRKERSSAVRAGGRTRAADESLVVVPQCGLGGSLDGFPAFVEHPRFPAGPGQPPGAWEPPRTISKGSDRYRRKRLHALGNAVVPAQIAPLFRAIAEAEAHSSGLSSFRRTKGSDEDGNDNH